jgi:hypothetical protein
LARSKSAVRRTAIGIVLIVVLSLIGGAAARAAPYPINVSKSGSNGQARTTEPGIDCPTGPGSYRHYLIESALAGGVISSLPGALRATLDVHYNGPGGPRSPAANQAFLEGDESHATLSNQRGTIVWSLSSGSCASKTLSFDGTTVSGTGTWSASGTGSYRQTTGSGLFNLTAELSPGADSPWTLALTGGSINVLQPDLTVVVDRTYWSHLGLDYVARIVSVDYRVANSGPGDAFGVLFLGAPSSASGVRECGEDRYYYSNPCALGPPPIIPLGDLASCPLASDAGIPEDCDSEIVTVRYKMDPVNGPCSLVLLACTFPTTVTVRIPDALDVATEKSESEVVTAPVFPPPL